MDDDDDDDDDSGMDDDAQDANTHAYTDDAVYRLRTCDFDDLQAESCRNHPCPLNLF